MKLHTIEIYEDPLHEKLIGAMDVPCKRLDEHVQALGKLICRIRKLSEVECIILDETGRAYDQITVFR